MDTSALWVVLFLGGVSSDQDTPMQAWTLAGVCNSLQLLKRILAETTGRIWAGRKSWKRLEDAMGCDKRVGIIRDAKHVRAERHGRTSVVCSSDQGIEDCRSW